ncbi:MAG: hypothetical protein JXQ84_09515 [Rhodospirillaceae bacterium]|nr:hypothetical protein [Rhodospirillaceae bacterium]
MSFIDLATLIINDRSQALAGIAAATAYHGAVHIETPADMADVLGPAWLRAFLGATPKPPCPVIFHCGTAPGLVLAALHLRLPALRFDPAPAIPARVTETLSEIAEHQGSVLLLGPPPQPHWRFPPPSGRPNMQALTAAATTWLNSL